MQMKKNKNSERKPFSFSEFCRNKENIKTAVIILVTVVVSIVLIGAALSTRDVFLGDFESGTYGQPLISNTGASRLRRQPGWGKP